jgi:crotonobetainyl-CoA:carnitine CoA-transferase CaiB-like acyl-CoA transferase
MLAVFDPLADLKVLDFSRVVTGPFATRMLADLGADVVKVEPPDGDFTRLWGQSRHGLTGFYTQQNAGKRNICVDLKADGAAELLLRLGAEADVVVENYRPGVMDRLGLGYDRFAAVNPDVVMLSISGFGQHGVWSRRAAFAPIIHAESGLIGRQALHDEAAPSDPMLSIADTNASLHGLVALLAALRLRDREGIGQHIDIAMLNTMTVTDDYAHNALDGEETVRLGGHTWPTSYGNILVSGNERAIWYQLSSAGFVSDGLGPDATLDEKIRARRDAMGAWFLGHDTRDELVAALDRANVAWADIRDPSEVFDTEAAIERRLSVEIDDRAGGSRRVVESPYRFSNAESTVRGPAPYRGEHNAEVLADWLAADAAEIERLTATQILLAEDQP